MKEKNVYEALEKRGITHVGVKEALKNYFAHHLAPGGFLTCVLTNDLSGAYARGDEEAIGQLGNIMVFLRCDVPAISWGTDDRFFEWISIKGEEHA